MNFAQEMTVNQTFGTTIRMYSHADRDSILKAFPDRTWVGIYSQASILKLSRPHIRSNSPLHDTICYNDYRFMQEMELEYLKSEERRRVWWKTLAVQKNDTSD